VSVARDPLRLVGPFAIVLASASLASGGTAATAPTNGEIVERAAQKSVLGTSRVEFRFAFMDSRLIGLQGGGIRDYQSRRGFVTMSLNYATATNQFLLPALRRWLAQPRLTQRQALGFRFDVAFGSDRTQIRIRQGNGRIRWRLVAPPTKQPFIFSSLAAVNADPVRVIRWLRSVSKRIVVPTYGRNVQVRGIDTTQYSFEVDPAKAARTLLPFFPMDQSREATLAQLRREIVRNQIRIGASVYVDHDGRLRQILQGYTFPEPGRPIQQARLESTTEFLNYGRPFYEARPPSQVTRKVPPFPGFETSWSDLENILSGAVRMS
jgi:hypothetical protein